MNAVAIIVAAGSGLRMGSDIPKQFLELMEKPVLLYSIDAFRSALPDCQLVVVMHPAFIQKAANLLKDYAPSAIIVPGGDTRTRSVRAALEVVDHRSIVLVHDAARCLVTPALITRCYNEAVMKGNAIPVIPVTDSIRAIDPNGSHAIDRTTLRVVQTPQAFQGTTLKTAYDSLPDRDFTDDASVLEAAGFPLNLIDGDETNIKITRPADLDIAETLIRRVSASTT